eukprot:3108774-Amphidinium_carterae.2
MRLAAGPVTLAQGELAMLNRLASPASAALIVCSSTLMCVDVVLPHAEYPGMEIHCNILCACIWMQQC